ncbi:hypothetical protein [Pseudofulvibacter geojedonensis]|uniref:Uncharacterized protein n=1 Tax=Pseudofulvibacter geojedonensis TaxID=1123758 RepID=A0ABW3HYD6_9FLAO
MKLFPSKTFTIELAEDKEVSLEKLKQRTKKSNSLISSYTDKTFIGKVETNNFKLISSEIGKGALCVFTGNVKNNEIQVTTTVNTPFKVLISIWAIGFFSFILFMGAKENFESLIPQLIPFLVFLLVIRYLFIGLFFKKLTNNGIKRFKDILNIKSLTIID